jgi:hypothetical protein
LVNSGAKICGKLHAKASFLFGERHHLGRGILGGWRVLLIPAWTVLSLTPRLSGVFSRPIPFNRFSGFLRAANRSNGFDHQPHSNTPLKQGVNETAGNVLKF